MTPKSDTFRLWGRLYSFEHNYLLDAHLFGEPHFESGCLWYQSGLDVSLVAFPIPMRDSTSLATIYALSDQFLYALRRGDLRSVKIFGRSDIVSDVLSTFKDYGALYYVSPVTSGDIIMDASLGERDLKPALRAGSRAKREGYRVHENRSRTVTAKHVALMRAFIGEREFENVDRIFASGLSLWVARSDVRVFEVFCGQELVGFFGVHEWSPRLAFFLFSFVTAGQSYIGDYIMQFLHDCYVRTGGRVLLGPAVNGDNERFKLKWGRDVGGGSTSSAIFWNGEDQGVREHLFVWWAKAAFDWQRMHAAIHV